MSHRRSSFERAYADGVLGIIEQQLRCRSRTRFIRPVPTDITQDIVNCATDYVSNAIDLRKQQALVDILIRESTTTNPKEKQIKKICAPHLPHEFKRIVPCSTKFLKQPKSHVSVLTKHRLTLAESLYYAMNQCSPITYHGVLMPYHVSISEGETDHANMIYLHFQPSGQRTSVHCYLLEPNGVGFTHKHPRGLTNLSCAWDYLYRNVSSTTLSVDVHPHVRVVGDKIGDPLGLQTYLGRFREMRTRKIGRSLQTTIYRSGYGICGAVTFWLFHMWLRSNTTHTLETYYAKLLQYVKKNRVESQHKIMKFIKRINQKVKKRYATLTAVYIDNDLDIIRSHLQKKYKNVLQSRRCQMNIDFTIQLGNGKVWLLDMQREIVLV